MPTKSSRRSGGFTLLELLLAITILGLLMATVYGSLARTESSKLIAESRAELYSAGRQAVLKMAGDLEAALPPPSGDRIYFRGTSGAGGAPDVQFVMMNRGGYGVQRVRPGRVLIVYSLTPLPSRRNEYALLREEYLYKTMLDKADGLTVEDEALDENAPPTEQASLLLECPDVPDDLNLPGACQPVLELGFRFYDDAVGDWRDEWDSTVDATLGRLPSAVEIHLVLADENGGAHEFGTIVDLPLARGQPTPVPGQAQTATDDPDDADDGDDEGDDEPESGQVGEK